MNRVGKSVWRRIFAWMLVLALSFLWAVPVFARAEKRLVRVGYYEQAGYQQISPAGIHYGYGYDYLQEIAVYANWEYEFVPGTWVECLQMLRDGKIDLLGAVVKTPERENEFNFAKLPSGTEISRLVTRPDDHSLAYEDFEAFNGMSVGLLRNNAQNEPFFQYCREHGFTVQPVYYDEHDQLGEALQNKEVRAVLTGGMSRLDNMREIAAFGGISNYYVTTKWNTALLEELNNALETIQLENPYFEMELYKKYYGNRRSSLPAFTRQELDYIERHPVVRYVYDPIYAPVAYRDEETGAYRGISAELLERIAENTGLKFENVPVESFSEAINSLTTGQADLLTGMVHDYNWAQENQVHQTRSYLHSQSVLVTSIYGDALGTVCLPEGYYVSDELYQMYPRENIVYYPTFEDCMEAVRTGKTGATFMNSYVAAYLTSNMRYSSLVTKNMSDAVSDICMAVSKQCDPLLISILNKAINSVPTDEMNRIVAVNNRSNHVGNFTDLVYMNPVGTIAIVLAVFLIICMVLFIIIRMKANANRDMMKMLYYDDLTGYGNYKLFLKNGQALVEQSSANRAVAYLDVHNFKLINDSFGYGAGDALLKNIATELNSFLEKGELFARIYADNFVVLLLYKEREELCGRMSKMLARLDAVHLEALENFRIEYCAGVFCFTEEQLSLEKAADRANFAKSLAQQDFKSSYTFYNPRARTQILEEKSLESSMRGALEAGQFIPYYQPKVNIETGEMIGCEALVRWNHPDAGLLLPGNFIPLFERNGFITQLDIYMFEHVCKHMREWLDKGLELVPISCNFSRRHIQDKELPNRLFEIAQRYKIPSSLLEMELTETVAVSNMQTAQELTQALKGFGFLTSIDDYGTGYSSISLMQQLPIDVLKLDKSFVETGMAGGKQGDIFGAIVDVAQRNGIMVICEGVETQEQEKFLLQYNCIYAQGFLYARPMPAADFEKALKRRMDMFMKAASEMK